MFALKLCEPTVNGGKNIRQVNGGKNIRQVLLSTPTLAVTSVIIMGYN